MYSTTQFSPSKGTLCRSSSSSAADSFIQGRAVAMSFRLASFSAVVLCLSLSLSSTAFGQERRQAELIGTWVWTVPTTRCNITRTFRADGTIQVSNGLKKTEGKFTVRTDRDSNVPMVIYTVTKDDGGRNCDGDSDDTTGKRYLSYFQTTGSSLLMCLSPDKSSCHLGPYRRQ